MNINGKSEAEFGCKILKFNPSNTKFINYGYHWPTSSLKGIKGKKNDTYRDLNIVVLFEAKKDEVYKKISRFLEEVKECVFNHHNLYYECEIQDGDNKYIRKGLNKYLIELKFNILDVYENEKTLTTTANTSIIINSPKECYANLEILAPINSISYTVKINDTEITVRNIKSNEKVYIGAGKVTAGGVSKINDVEIWEFPRLKPGVNNIEVNRSDINLIIKYNERW